MSNFRQTDQPFAGNSEMAMRMRSHDWSETLLGPVSSWAPSLKTAVSICLNSRFPMVIWWGKDLVLLYNDAWRPILGTKHPAALGQPGQAVWSEIWDIIGAQLHGVLETAEATWSEDMLLLVDRYGYIEEAYFTYSYSPIFLDTGAVGGAFTAVTETTRRVIGERRLSTLRELAANTVEAKQVEETCRIASATLANNPYDLPFALLYLVEEGNVRLVETVGIDAGTPASPEQIDLTQDNDCWQFAKVRNTGTAEVIDDLVTRFGAISSDVWHDPIRSAIVLPITQSGQKQQLAALLVLGISPRLGFDDEYQGFFDLVASNIATAIANANAYEAERKRAEALAEIDRAKTLFFTNVSHEFRTPLTLMLSPLEELSTVLEGRLEPDEREQLILMQRNGLRLQKLVNTLLDFSRIEAGRIEAVYEPIDLAAYTVELASAFRSLMAQAGLSLLVECLPLPEAVYVDREMWEKIVLNLLSNAFKFTLAGSITVRLQWLEKAVAFMVSDTGVGVPPEELPHLFERFHQVKNAQGRSFEGSGIGLSLVQELVKLHHGTIAVTSTVGQGSCFTVSIPTGTAHLPTNSISKSCTLTSTALGATPYVKEAQRWLLPEGETGTGDTQPFPAPHFLLPTPHTPHPTPSLTTRVLLVDDNADMRDYIQRLLGSIYQVEAVADGVAALSSAQTNPPDLVLSDVMMPHMDGFELLRQLRTGAQTQEIPIILLSARAGEEARIEGLAAGADDYLIKPFSARELMARVEATLKLAQLRRTARERERALQLETQTVRADLDRILSNLWEGFLTFDRDWRYTYVNDRQLEIIGMSREAVMGRNVWEIFPDIVETEIYHQFHRAMNEQVAVQFEVYYPPLDGWFDHRVYPTEDGIAIFVTDVSERARLEAQRKQAEQALRESEARFRQMTDTAPMLVWMSGLDKLCYYFNQTWLDFTGRTIEQELGNGWAEGVHPDDFQRCLNTYAAAFDARQPFEMDYRLRRFDGAYRWLIDTGVPRFTAAGEFLGYIGSCVDIHDRKQAEDDLRQSEERYRTLFESIDEGFAIVEMLFDENETPIDYRFLEVNPTFEQQTGLRQAVGKTARQLVPDLEDHWIQRYGQVALTGEPSRFESGSEVMHRWFDVYTCRTGQPEAHKVAMVFKDVSDRKRIEAEREQILQREQTAREQAETANRIKDEFLAVLSHELRTPMNPILGWSSLLRQGKLEPTKIAQAVESIERNARLQVQLIDDLLDISRILRGKLALNLFPVDLKFAIHAALETVRLAVDAKAIVLQTHFVPAVEQVMGDVGRLQQVVWNLLSNAVKFTPIGGQITVTLTQVGTNAQIQVTDTGKGIHPDFLPYMFEHFRQEDAATTRKFGGLGLGLAIARQIVELHGGSVSATSDGEGQGATFTVKMPLLSNGSRERGRAENPVLTALDSPLAGLHILVVDDEVDSLALVRFVLEQAGAIVASTASGIKALQAIKESVPDLILSDIGMPDMDGYQLMQAIRSLEQTRDVPAIALTAYAGEIDQQQAIAVGFQQHLPKPIEPEKLISTIYTLCSVLDFKTDRPLL